MHFTGVQAIDAPPSAPRASHPHAGGRGGGPWAAATAAVKLSRFAMGAYRAGR
jgi:hypothetical protein